jgi:hypothetical protein
MKAQVIFFDDLTPIRSRIEYINFSHYMQLVDLFPAGSDFSPFIILERVMNYPAVGGIEAVFSMARIICPPCLWTIP